MAIKCDICNQMVSDYGDHVRSEHPLTHAEVRDLLERYEQGTLDLPTEQRVVCHLTSCDSCSGELADLRDREHVADHLPVMAE